MAWYEALHRLEHTSDPEKTKLQGHCSKKLDVKLSLAEIKKQVKQKIFHPVDLHKLRPVDINVTMSLLPMKMASLVKTHLVLFTIDNKFFHIHVINIYYIFFVSLFTMFPNVWSSSERPNCLLVTVVQWCTPWCTVHSASNFQPPLWPKQNLESAPNLRTHRDCPHIMLQIVEETHIKTPTFYVIFLVKTKSKGTFLLLLFNEL